MRKEENRNMPRFNFSFKVYDPDGKLLGITKDISSDGCFLKTKEKIMRDILSISIELPGTLDRLDMECKVVRSDNVGVGTKLILDEENISNFSRVIENYNLFKK